MLLLATMLVALLAACGNNKTSNGNAMPGKTGSEHGPDFVRKQAELPIRTLKVMLFGDKPIEMDKVLAEFEKRTKDTLNTKLDIEFNPFDDHK